MNFKNAFIIVFVVIFTKMTMAQEGLPVYSDYLTDNYYLLHPSMAGASNCSQIRITGRRNWVGQEDAPGLFTAAYNTRVGDQSGIGAILYNDKNGYYSQTGGYATYAHHLMFSRSESDLNQLSFGLSAGVIQYRLDQSTFVANGDALISSRAVSSSEFNMDIGLSYNLYNFYTHVTLKNLLDNSGVNSDLQASTNLRNLLVSLGYVIARPGKTWSFEPSILYSYREGIKQSNVDFNLKAYGTMKFGKLWGGVSYRTSLDAIEFVDGTESKSQNLNYITPFMGVNFGKYMVAYTYSYQSNPVTFNNGGFHQITLGIDFGCREKKYECYCPWVE
ncbi:type IX secretion system membrane protein PorP/SprF [Aquimarina addita]|uniref:Type IX secretion system membrane protein PorP/SprF n=1 Tax=Aquimarina addita TaxID=870485 RepID=A0ABP6UVQ6_9FLAO